MWDYIYYYNHLEKIDINDHNAIDSYVYQQVMIFHFACFILPATYVYIHR